MNVQMIELLGHTMEVGLKSLCYVCLHVLCGMACATASFPLGSHPLCQTLTPICLCLQARPHTHPSFMPHPHTWPSSFHAICIPIPPHIQATCPAIPHTQKQGDDNTQQQTGTINERSSSIKLEVENIMRWRWEKEDGQ